MGSRHAIREMVPPFPLIRILATLPNRLYCLTETVRLKVLKTPQRTLGQITRVTLSARIRYSVVRDRFRPCGRPLRD